MTPQISALTPRDLLYIVAIADAKSFKIASQNCSVAQPALSAQVKKVEEILNLRIFERTGKGVFITQSGEEIVEQCRTVLSEMETLGSIARRSRSPLYGKLRLGIVSSLAQYILPNISSLVLESFPNLELILRENVSNILLEDLKTNKLDALISDLPLPIKNCSTFFLFEEPLILMISKNHYLAQRAELKLRDLNSSDIVFHDQNSILTKQALELLPDSQTYSPASFTYSGSLELLRFMVATSERYALVPLLAALTPNELNELLVFKPIVSKKAKSRKLSLVWRKRYPGSQDLESFGSLIGKQMTSVIEKLSKDLDIRKSRSSA